MRYSPFIVFAALALAPAVPAQAGGKTVEIKIPYDDLDLADPADVDKMERRIALAVKDACSLKPAYTTSGRMLDQACADEARMAALKELKRR